MKAERRTTPLNKYQERIVRQLLYYDVFDHLLTRKELVKDCALGNNPDTQIDELIDKGLILKQDGYFTIRQTKGLAEKRKKGEENTQQSIPRAFKMARFINKFPFVRSVSLSGSISKGYMDSFKDIDYFIITKPRRLWLSRTILVFYKKVFLLNSFRYFCLNYFIDENNLEIDGQNIFTATEINTLIPVCGLELMESFNRSNQWVKKYYPDFPQRDPSTESTVQNSFLKRISEFLLSNFIGNWLDLLAMKFTVRYWKWKYKGDKSYLFKSSFRFRRDEAKYHPGNFQQLVLEKFNEKVKAYEQSMNVSLKNEN